MSIRRKGLLPEVIAQHDNCSAAWSRVVRRHNGAAKEGLSAKNAEVIA